MRVAILTSVLGEGPSGVGWHVLRLIQHLAVIDPSTTFFLVERVHSRDKRIPETARDYEGYPPMADNVTRVPVYCPRWLFERQRGVFQKVILPRALKQLKVDVVHGPGQQLPKPHKNQAGRRVPQILTVHDLAIGLGFAPEDRRLYLETLLNRYLSWADVLVALSKFTRDDLIQEFEIAPEQIRVIYEGGHEAAPGSQTSSDSLPGVSLPPVTDRPYVLYAGAIEPRRNLMFLVNAFARLKTKIGSDYALVLAGRYDDEEHRRLTQQALGTGIAEDVVFTGNLNQTAMQTLYEGASAFVMPSLHEGFGIAALEAMAHGVPVIAARAGALPEVVGPAGVLVDLDDVDGLAQKMVSVLTDGVLALDLIRRGQQRVKQFSWRRMAEQTLGLYRQLAEPSGR